MIDIERAAEFIRTHARLLDRRRFELRFGGGSAEVALAALSGYRNDDGGFGAGLEPDLRSRTSQPGGALHAFEVFEEVAPITSPMAVELCGWLGSVSFPDGSLPFAFAMDDGAGSAPFWAKADPAEPSLFITSAVAGAAQRVADSDPAVAAHPWLASVTEYCLGEIAALDSAPFAIAHRFILQFLDAIHDKDRRAPEELARVADWIPKSGSIPVPSQTEGERLSPLDISPIPDRPLRTHMPAAAVSDDLDEVATGQQDDGGWNVDFASYSPQAALEWRGYKTVWALTVLKENGRLSG